MALEPKTKEKLQRESWAKKRKKKKEEEGVEKKESRESLWW